MIIEWRSYEDLARLCRANVEAVRRLGVDTIVGVPRSGMIPASILATALGLPLVDVHTFCEKRTWRVRGPNEVEPAREKAAKCRASRVLLVDDASAFLRAMPAAVALIKENRPEVEVLTCTAYAEPASADKFHLAMELCPKPRLFEWNWWRSGKLKWCCVDIDGIICRDPSGVERRNPEAYLKFLENAQPLYLPAKGFVGALVTGRSAQFRKETHSWMERHGVEYGKLEMFDGPSPRNTEKHASSKADFYKALPETFLFFESSVKQASLIAQMSRKNVVCVPTGQLHSGG